MTVPTFNDGWREGCNDAIGQRPPVYTDGPPHGLSRHFNNGTGAGCGVEPHREPYARGYIGGYAAKTVTPSTEAPDDPEPITLAEMVTKIRHLRRLCNSAEDAAMDPVAEQFFLLAVDAIKQAQRFATLADLHQARALAEQQRSIR